MKPMTASLMVLSLTAVSGGAEPLYVPSVDYAYVQPGVPQVQPVPESHLGTPAPDFGGSLPALPTNPQMIPSQPQVIESYPAVGPSYGSPLPTGPVISGQVVPLYQNVKVRSAHLAWPGGVSEVVQIPSPVPRSGNCEPVYVQICVPPGCQPSVSYGPKGQRVTYAFGGYRVVVTSLRGVVTVDYDRKI